jgi:hypothetical protein
MVILYSILCRPNGITNFVMNGFNDMKTQSIWQFQKMLTRRLFVWSGVTIAAGLGMQPGGQFWRAVGTQAIGWGAIDAIIAWFGQFSAQRKQARLPDPQSPTVVVKETRNLRRLLWVNTVLDVFYITGGLLLALTRGKTNRTWRGHGWGIIIQGGFLFLFDLYHALRLPPKEINQ